MPRRILAFAIVAIVILVGITALAARPGTEDTPGNQTNADDISTSALQTAAVPPVVESTPTSTPQELASPPTPTPEIPAAATAEPTHTALATTPAPAEPTVTIVPTRVVEAPLSIAIPVIDVNTTIEWVGLDENGDMDVPSAYDTVAWYERGARPGSMGNAVIAGHLDSRSGPAIFYRLRDLNPGDEIIVTTHDGEELRFVVDRIAAFDTETAPRYEIFGPTTSANLNLITCQGTFDRAAGAYDERLVVYSTLVT